MNNKIIILTIVLIGIIVVGGVVALHTGIWSPAWNPFQRPASEIVLERMIKAMDEVKTYHEATDIKIEMENVPSPDEIGIGQVMDISISLDYQVDTDTTVPQAIMAAGGFGVDVAMNETKFALDGEIAAIGKMFYFKLTAIPLPAQPFLEKLGLDLKDQWIKIDTEQLEKKLGAEADEEALQETKKMEEELIALFEINRIKRLFYVKEEFPEAQINGRQVYHYLIGLNKEETKKIISDIFGIVEKAAEKAALEQGLEEEDFRKGLELFMAGLDKFFGAIGEIIVGEIWIGKQDYLLYRALIEKEIDITDIKELDRIIKEIAPDVEGLSEDMIRDMSGIIISIIVESNYSNFNQPKEIKAPEQYKTLDQIMPKMPGI